MKTRKRNKQGISLIVLVITIIVMIILATAVILSLSSNGLIDRANEAVQRTDEKQVQVLAQTIWAEVYLDDREGKVENFELEVLERLGNALGLKEAEEVEDYYDVTFLQSGIEVKLRETNIAFNHSGKIPAGGIYFVGVTSSTPGDYTGATAVYYGGYEEDASSSIDSQIKFGAPYFATDDILSYAILHTDGSAEFYISGQPNKFPAGTITYSGNNIFMNGNAVATITDNGEIDATSFMGKIFKLANERTSFPETVNDNDVYVYGDYEYRYNCLYAIYDDETNGLSIGWVPLSTNTETDFDNGWGVRVLNSEKSEYGDMLYSINDAYVVNACFAYFGCKNLIYAPAVSSHVTIIDFAFYDCESLTRVSLHNNRKLTHIGDSAFHSCKNLISIEIPNNVTGIDRAAFVGCTSLTSVAFGKHSQLTDIKELAFRNCANIKSITIPESVTTIGYSAFEGCTGLENIIIPDSVTVIDSSTFYDCTSLASVTFGENSQLISIERFVFRNCASIKNINIPDGVTTIEEEAFYYCSSLTSITIPESVTEIGSSAFEGSNQLTTITFEGSVEKWNAITKAEDWRSHSAISKVVCSDGTVNL